MASLYISEFGDLPFTFNGVVQAANPATADGRLCFGNSACCFDAVRGSGKSLSV